MDLGLLGEILEQYYYFICSIPEFSNKVGEYLKDSKDVIIALLAVIFTTYIPFLLYFYQVINGKEKFKYLDLNIFHKNVFNLRKIFGVIIFLIIILLFWNTSDFSDYYWINIIILLISIFPFGFFINNLFKLYELNENLREEKKSKNIIELRLNSIKNLKLNQENFYIFRDILQNKNLENYSFTQEFLKIFFSKIKENLIRDHRGLIIDVLNLYKDLDKNSAILLSFKLKNFNQLLEIYKIDYENGEFDVDIRAIFEEIVKKRIIELGDNIYSLSLDLKNFLENIEDENLKYYLLSDFQDMIFSNQEILENRKFIKYYGKDIYQNFKDTQFNPGEKVTSTIQGELYQKLIQVLQFEQSKYNQGYDNILRFCLLDYEPILFTRLLYLYYAPFGENRAISILEHKIVFGGIGRVKTYRGDGEKDLEAENKQEEEDTIRLFVKEFGGNKQVLENLKIQFQEIIAENKRGERDIRKSKYYIGLIDKLIKEGEKNKKDEK